MNKIQAFIANVFAFASIILLGFGLIYSGFDELHNGLFCLALSFLTGLISLMRHEANKPKYWMH